MPIDTLTQLKKKKKKRTWVNRLFVAANFVVHHTMFIRFYINTRRRRLKRACIYANNYFILAQ